MLRAASRFAVASAPTVTGGVVRSALLRSLVIGIHVVGRNLHSIKCGRVQNETMRVLMRGERISSHGAAQRGTKSAEPTGVDRE